VLTALTFPILATDLIIDLLARAGGGTGEIAAGPVAPLYLTTIVAGFVSTIVVGLMGLARRGQLRQAWILALTPIYWGCLSIAAWRALHQLLTEPYRWEKTEHGLSRQTRSSASPVAFPSEAESGSREETALDQETGGFRRFRETVKASKAPALRVTAAQRRRRYR
jgi:hypothetical protein